MTTEYAGHICQICGKLEMAYFDQAMRDELIERGMCFRCNFWFNHRLRDDENDHWYEGFVINGAHYATSRPYIVKGDNRSLGCAGQRFTIRHLETGEQIVTNDLWYQGEVPELFRERFPDTAEFVR